MSYWVSTTIDTGGDDLAELESRNMTSNVAPKATVVVSR